MVNQLLDLLLALAVIALLLLPVGWKWLRIWLEDRDRRK